AELRHKLCGAFFCVFLGKLLQRGTALDDGFVKETFGRGHGEEGADFASAAGLAEDGHIAGIASKTADVVVHPLKRRHDVEHADVSRVGKVGACAAQIEMAENIEPVID